MTLHFPIIVDATDWTLDELRENALEIKIDGDRILAHVGNVDLTFDDYLKLNM